MHVPTDGRKHVRSGTGGSQFSTGSGECGEFLKTDGNDPFRSPSAVSAKTVYDLRQDTLARFLDQRGTDFTTELVAGELQVNHATVSQKNRLAEERMGKVVEVLEQLDDEGNEIESQMQSMRERLRKALKVRAVRVVASGEDSSLILGGTGRVERTCRDGIQSYNHVSGCPIHACSCL